jgi:phenylalanyl-tRNA synthetase alpha chain
MKYIETMEELLKQIQDHKMEIEVFTTTAEKAVEKFRIKWLGTKGMVKTIMGEMKNVLNGKKKEFGQILDEFKLLEEIKRKFVMLDLSLLSKPSFGFQ